MNSFVFFIGLVVIIGIIVFFVSKRKKNKKKEEDNNTPPKIETEIEQIKNETLLKVLEELKFVVETKQTKYKTTLMYEEKELEQFKKELYTFKKHILAKYPIIKITTEPLKEIYVYGYQLEIELKY